MEETQPRRGRGRGRGRGAPSSLRTETREENEIQQEIHHEEVAVSEEIQSNPRTLTGEAPAVGPTMERAQEEQTTGSVRPGVAPAIGVPGIAQNTLEDILRLLVSSLASRPPPPTTTNEPFPSLGRYVKELRELGCENFMGQADPETALQWITKVEATLKDDGVPEALQVRATSQLLIHAAHSWWGTIASQYPPGSVIPWEEFRRAFDEQYYTRTMRKEKETEFLYLKQGNHSVLEYQRRFQELSLFAGRVIRSEADRIERFVDGLRPELYGAVATLRLLGRPLMDIVEVAQSTERANRDYVLPMGPPKAKGEYPAPNNKGAGTSRPPERARIPMVTQYSGRKRTLSKGGPSGSREPTRFVIPKYLPCKRCK